MTGAKRLTLLLVGAGVCVALGGCGSSGSKADSSSPPYRLTSENVQPGEGVLQLGAGRYPFKVVNCGTGPLKGDVASLSSESQVPPTAERVWGLYGNGTTEGSLFTVALTEYRSQVGSGPATLTQTALVRMDVPSGAATIEPDISSDSSTPTTGSSASEQTTTTADSVEHLGLTAQRFKPVEASTWTDPRDSNATDELVKITGATYVVAAKFGPAGSDLASESTQDGQVTARCPDKPTT